MWISPTIVPMQFPHKSNWSRDITDFMLCPTLVVRFYIKGNFFFFFFNLVIGLLAIVQYMGKLCSSPVTRAGNLLIVFYKFVHMAFCRKYVLISLAF